MHACSRLKLIVLSVGIYQMTQTEKIPLLLPLGPHSSPQKTPKDIFTECSEVIELSQSSWLHKSVNRGCHNLKQSNSETAIYGHKAEVTCYVFVFWSINKLHCRLSISRESRQPHRLLIWPISAPKTLLACLEPFTKVVNYHALNHSQR